MTLDDGAQPGPFLHGLGYEVEVTRQHRIVTSS